MKRKSQGPTSCFSKTTRIRSLRRKATKILTMRSTRTANKTRAKALMATLSHIAALGVICVLILIITTYLTLSRTREISRARQRMHKLCNLLRYHAGATWSLTSTLRLQCTHLSWATRSSLRSKSHPRRDPPQPALSTIINSRAAILICRTDSRN